MRSIKLILAVVFVISLTACAPVSSPVLDTTPTPTPESSPEFTFSPIIIATPTPEFTPVPTASPMEPPKDQYIYLIDGVGNGEFPYAWTDEVVAKGPIEYGTTNSSSVKAIKERLTQLGFYCGAINGSFDSKLRTAINEFQDVIGAKRTSRIEQELIDILFSPNGIKGLAITDYEIVAGSLAGMTVFVDAGHGGGATGTAEGALVEKTIVAEQSYRIKNMLEAAGARVIMLRQDDSEITLTYRSAYTNYIVLQDMISQTQDKISALRLDIEDVLSYTDFTYSELREELKLLTLKNNELFGKSIELDNAIESAKAQYGGDSNEYNALLNQKSEFNKEIEAHRLKLDIVRKRFYNYSLNVDFDQYTGAIRDEIAELERYCAKLGEYKEMFEINVQNPYVEYEGLYVKTYGDDGNKIIEPALAEIFELTGEYCKNHKYAFISVHINGVDNAPNVCGTEIYVRCKNNPTSSYGINKNYYSNYAIEERNALASAIKDAYDTILPLRCSKPSKIKDMDAFVLREANVPSILLEMGYVTNESDRVSMLTPEVRNKFAYGIYLGLCNFYLG